MNPVGSLHAALIQHRRARVLSRHLAPQFPRGARVLDVGCGDGELASRLMGERPDLTLHGIEVMVRARTHIPVIPFDGENLPFQDGTFDCVMFVDVLHHTPDPDVLLAEARRVATRSIVVKDHLRDSRVASWTLRVMDWVGNAHRGVTLPYNYWSSRRWTAAFDAHGLRVASRRTDLELYPFPASWLFCRGLHFIAVLDVEGS